MQLKLYDGLYGIHIFFIDNKKNIINKYHGINKLADINLYNSIIKFQFEISFNKNNISDKLQSILSTKYKYQYIDILNIMSSYYDIYFYCNVCKKKYYLNYDKLNYFDTDNIIFTENNCICYDCCEYCGYYDYYYDKNDNHDCKCIDTEYQY